MNDNDWAEQTERAVAAAEDRGRAEGYQQAIAALRDDERYRNWWTSSGSIPDGPIRRHLADYLEVIAKERTP